MHLAFQTTSVEQFDWGLFAKHVLRINDNSGGIEDWGAWLKGLWEGTGLFETIAQQAAEESIMGCSHDMEQRGNDEGHNALNTSAHMEADEQTPQVSGPPCHPSTSMNALPMDEDAVEEPVNGEDDDDCGPGKIHS